MQAFDAVLSRTNVLCISVTLTLSLGGEAGTGNDSAVTWEDRKTQKACLERYRVASAEIIAVFHEVAPEGIVEKASIDEAYIDVTSIVDAHLQVSHVAQSSSLAACNMAYLAGPGECKKLPDNVHCDLNVYTCFRLAERRNSMRDLTFICTLSARLVVNR